MRDADGKVIAQGRARRLPGPPEEGLRFEHRDALFPLVEARVKGWDRAPLEAAMDAKGCCFGGYATMTDAARDPVLVTANPIFGRTANPSGLDYPAAGPFATIPDQPRGAPQPAPRLGQHSGELLSLLLGLGDGEIDRLIDQGVVARG